MSHLDADERRADLCLLAAAAVAFGSRGVAPTIRRSPPPSTTPTAPSTYGTPSSIAASTAPARRRPRVLVHNDVPYTKRFLVEAFRRHGEQVEVLVRGEGEAVAPLSPPAAPHKLVPATTEGSSEDGARDGVGSAAAEAVADVEVEVDWFALLDPLAMQVCSHMRAHCVS